MNRSLKRLLDYYLVILFLIFIGYVVINLSNIEKSLKELEKDKIYLILKNEEVILTNLLKYEFKNELNEEIKRIISVTPEIENIIVKCGNNKFKFNDKISENRVDLINNGCEIVAYYTPGSLIQAFFKKYMLRFVIYFIIFTPIIIFLFSYIRERIVKLNLLAKEVKKINFKKTKKINKVDDYVEINYITEAINSLLNQVNIFYENQKELIKKIVQYKKHLENAQKIAQMFSWDYDCKKKSFYVSKKSIRFLGVKRIKNLDDFLEYLTQESKKVFLENLKNSCKNCESFEVVLNFINSNKKEFYLKTVGKCIKGEVIGTSLNITDEFLKQQKIEFLAYHDPLTGLSNRTYLKEYFKTLITIAKRFNKKIGVLYLDLDNFKMINDTLGHENGDKLLIEISKKIKKVLRESDFFARIGGDEFVILLNDINSKKDIEKVINKITAVLQEPITIKSTKIHPTFSIGASIFPDDSNDAEELLRYADIAMYDAKNRGKNSFSFINEDLKNSVFEYYNIINEIKDGIKREEFVLFFQPKIKVRTKEIIGAEALIRWNHPKRGLLTPFYFISYAERSNLITEIDKYVLKKAVETLSIWQKDSKLKNLVLAINISAKQFKEENFILYLKELINSYKIDPSKLEIEITESIGMSDISYALMILEYIKNLGVKVAIDDFGTGYSSLNYIKKLPFDTLKIDQTFVRELLTNSKDTVITEMIIQIAKVLNKVTVAEGVESKELFETMKRLNCDIVQGYYFSPPVDYENFLELVRK